MESIRELAIDWAVTPKKTIKPANNSKSPFLILLSP
jgi:hypothetical protein